MSKAGPLLKNRIEDYKSTLSKVSLDTFYQVHFDFGTDWWKSYPGSAKRSDGYDPTQKMSILCSEADLPGPSFNLKSVTGHRQGIVEQFPTLKSYPNINLAFYVDSEHQILDIFEDWMRYISPVIADNMGRIPEINFGQTSQGRPERKNAHQRLRYPDTYKERIQITKFERDTLTHQNGSMMVRRDRPSPMFTYEFVNIWPVNLNSMKVSYGESDVLKCFIEFAYDRYFVKDAGVDGTVNAVTQDPIAMVARDTPWVNRGWVNTIGDVFSGRDSGLGSNDLSGTTAGFA